jgi:hypothetical protein
MSFAIENPRIGNSQIGFGGLAVDATAQLPEGLIVVANDPWWGSGEFIYARANGAIRTFGLCQLNPTFDATNKKWQYEATEAASTAILGRTVCVAMKVMADNEYGWFCIGGVVPVNSNAAVAADTTFSVAATGQGGAAAAGKQIVNARIVGASTITVAKTNCRTKTAITTTLEVPNSDGWFVGAYLSGTGVGAACIVSSISPDGRTVTMSVASTAVISANQTAICQL